MRKIRYLKSFKKDLKKYSNSTNVIKELENVLARLICDEKLDKKYKDHALITSKKYKNSRECHIRPDVLLVYRLDKKENELILILIRIGSHSKLFG